MPAINLPTINIDKEDFKSKETMENILDTLIKYRKELNYLLMNLDVDNMPLVGGLIGEIEGNYSLLTQTVDGIYMQVGNIEGDMADFRVEADNISAMVTNQSGDIAALVIRANGIDTIVSNQAGDISAVTQTANNISSIVSGHTTTIAGHTTSISTINQTMSGITSTVSSNTSTIGTHTSQISQMSGNISSIVSFTDVTGNQIASKINQTATTISLSASKIDLTGITRIYSPSNPNHYTEFDGGTLKLVYNNRTTLQIQTGVVVGAELYVKNNEPIYAMAPLDSTIGFVSRKNSTFYGAVDFSGATVTGFTMKFA